MIKSKLLYIFLVIFFPFFSSFFSHAGNNSGQAFTSWPDPGQTNCYDNSGNLLDPCPDAGEAFHGQDAQSSGMPKSYTKMDENGNDLPDNATSWFMVRDNVTGLVWEIKEASNGILDYNNLQDADNTYTWCNTNSLTNGGSEGECTESNNTMAFITALNSATYLGHDDWRLPTLKELLTLVEHSEQYPSISTDFFPQTKLEHYWTASTTSAIITSAWTVRFDKGYSTYNFGKSNFRHVRAVRGGTPVATNNFIYNQNGIVTDSNTCLEWSYATIDTDSDGNPDRITWQQALEEAELYTLGGYNDWRVPEINELNSLIDNSSVNPSINTLFKSTTENSLYWSSTSGLGTGGTFIEAWVANFSYGLTATTNKSIEYYVRPVRGSYCGSKEGFSWNLFLPAITNKSGE